MKSELFCIHKGNSNALKPLVLPLGSADELISATFNKSETRLACITTTQNLFLLKIYDKGTSPSDRAWKLQVSHSIGDDATMDPQAIRVAFHPTSPTLFAFSYWNYMFENGAWLAEITEQNLLTTTQLTGTNFKQSAVSLMGTAADFHRRVSSRPSVLTVWEVCLQRRSQRQTG